MPIETIEHRRAGGGGGNPDGVGDGPGESDARSSRPPLPRLPRTPMPPSEPLDGHHRPADPPERHAQGRRTIRSTTRDVRERSRRGTQALTSWPSSTKNCATACWAAARAGVGTGGGGARATARARAPGDGTGTAAIAREAEAALDDACSTRRPARTTCDQLDVAEGGDPASRSPDGEHADDIIRDLANPGRSSWRPTATSQTARTGIQFWIDDKPRIGRAVAEALGLDFTPTGDHRVVPARVRAANCLGKEMAFRNRQAERHRGDELPGPGTRRRYAIEVVEQRAKR